MPPFFHRRTLQRRKNNRISSLKSEEGEWLYEETVLLQEAIKFFQKLCGGHPARMRDLPADNIPRLDSRLLLIFFFWARQFQRMKSIQLYLICLR